MFYQHTIAKEISLSGVGLFSGCSVEMTLRASEENRGIFFQRTDLPSKPVIPADFRNVSSTFRSTCLEKNGASVHMVEHFLSALKAFSIDNLEVLIHGGELPCGDGSALLFTQLLEEAGTLLQEAPKKVWKVEKPLYFSDNDVHLVALPFDGLKVSYTLHYPRSQLLHSQYYSFVMNKDAYCREIAPCRTFALQEDLQALQKKGLLQEVSLENGVLIQGDQVVNPEGLRFANSEMARHKILDLIGDLSLLGCDVHAHIIAIRSGHTSHIAFCQILHDFIGSFLCAAK